MPSQNPDPCIPPRIASDDPPGEQEGTHRSSRNGGGDPADLPHPIEASFRHFAESLSDLVWSARPDGRIDYYNRRLLDYLGTTFEVMQGLDRAETLHPDDIERSRRAWEDASTTGIEYEIEYRIRRHDGQYRWHRSHATPMRDADGRIVRWFGTCVDVDDARRAEEAIRASEQRFRHLADAIPQMVWVTRPDRSVEYVNRRWLDYTGQTPDEALGPEGWATAVHPEDIGTIMKASVRSHATGEPFEAEYRIRDASGAYRWHLGRAVPIFDEAGRVVRRFGAATDIDDRRRAEHAARLLAEASATLSALVDEAATLEQVARLAVPDFADWSAVDLAGEGGLSRRLAVAHVDPAKVVYAHELQRRYPPDPDAPQGASQVIRTGESQLVSEINDEMLVAGARDDAHLRILRELGLKSYLCVPLKGRGGTLGAISFVAAESGRRYGPDDLRLAEDLASRAAIAIENARLYAELREADRRKDDFLATLAHELRNPLAPIRTSLEVLRRERGDVEAQEQARSIMERQVRQMVRLIDDLMDISRIGRNRLELRRERAALGAVVRDAVDASRPLIEASGHQLAVSLPAEPIHLDADPARLAQVISNLLNNAAKYTEPGGHIALTAERGGGDLVLTVRDTGVGISAEMLPGIFEMFAQVDRSLERSQGGLGIGLTLVRRLVEMHGGTIEARSEGIGRGSEFVVRLPVRGERPEPARPEFRPADRERPAPAPRRILVVDDNHDAARSLARLLKLAGNEVRTAGDGREAVVAAAAFRPDAVLLDIGLPVLNGYDAARQIRAQPWGGDMVLIALTGWGQDEDRRRSREAGFDHHLVKPVDTDTMMRILDDLQTTPA